MLTDDQRTFTVLHSATRALAERGNSLLKTTVKALRLVSFSTSTRPDNMIKTSLLGKAHGAHVPR